MLEILDYLVPIIGIIIMLILDDRWKQKHDIPLMKNILIVVGKVSTMIVSMLLLLFVFGYLLKVSEIQLLPIIAVGIGCSYALASHLFEHFYVKNSYSCLN
jgi:hypothetical protein